MNLQIIIVYKYYQNQMISLKDQGNDEFKKRNYKQAILCYEKYVEQDHDDNKNAHFNLGLCYSKLKQHQKSIEACQTAVTIDPTYAKAYYKLMQQYQFLGNSSYQIFINAALYLRHSKNIIGNEVQRTEVTEKMKRHKQKFISPDKFKFSFDKEEKLKDKDQLFKLIEPLKNSRSQHFNEQIDKYASEWINEWSQQIQSEDAKWQQIAYIIRDIDYNQGINLAYFYLNQLKTKKQQKIIINKIKEIKQEMKQSTNQPLIAKQDLDVTQSQPRKRQFQDNSQQIIQKNDIILQKSQETNQIQERNHIFKIIKDEKQQQIRQQPTKIEQKVKNLCQNIPKKVSENKIIQLLQQKSLNRKKLENQQHLNTEDSQFKDTSPIKAQQPPTTEKNRVGIQQKTNKIQELTNEKSSEQLEQLYLNYNSYIQKPKDLFCQTYQTICRILQGSESAQNKGKLLIILKKRVKKFKVIVKTFSQNEQKTIYDLLVKHKIQEYAVDFAPLYFKLESLYQNKLPTEKRQQKNVNSQEQIVQTNTVQVNEKIKAVTKDQIREKVQNIQSNQSINNQKNITIEQSQKKQPKLQKPQIQKPKQSKNIQSTKSNPPDKKFTSAQQEIIEKSEQQLEQLYLTYNLNSQKPKDLFSETYQTICKILQGSENAENKGKLLIILKKRVKKFKMIVKTFIQNEQKTIYELLVKNGIQEYAVDFAPIFYKL